MKTTAAASLTCLLFLGGCTLSPLVSRLASKPAPPRGTASERNTQTSRTPAPARTAQATRTTGTPVAPPAGAAPAEGRAALGIPPEQIPSPGECRLWLPEVPPADQSSPGPCSLVQQKVPAGAWVLHRSVEKTNEVAVNVYRSRWPVMVSETRYFDYWTGSFLRAE